MNKMKTEKTKYVIVDIHGSDRWYFEHDNLVGKTVTLAPNREELAMSLFGLA